MCLARSAGSCCRAAVPLNQDYSIRREEEDDPALPDDECCIP